jgi:hypothetical protein
VGGGSGPAAVPSWMNRRLMDMVIPDVFKDLCRLFHQDVILIYSAPEQMIADSLEQMRDGGQLNDHRKRVLRQFLNELLSGHHTHAEILQIWEETQADITFSKGEPLLRFLRLIRDDLR